MSRAGRTVHDLVPGFHRSLDDPSAGGDGLLASLLDVLQSGSLDVEAQLLRELDDRFVETCGDEEFAHFAALLGIRELPGRRARRALIANITAYRRRKGTVAALEDVVRAATGWTTKATEYFPLLVGSVNVNHTRPGHVDVLDVRDPVLAARAGTPFDPSSHAVDVREVRFSRGRYNIGSVAVDLWRLAPVAERRRPLLPQDGQRFHVHPLGLAAALWSRGDPEPSVEHRVGIGDTTSPISIAEAWADWGRFYGPMGSICLYRSGVAVDGADVTVCDLGESATGWGSGPPPTPFGLDPSRGRVVATGATDDLTVTWHRALPLPLGGGGYARDVRAVPAATTVRTLAGDGTGDADGLDTVLTSFPADASSRHVWVQDSASFAAPTVVTVPADTTLVLSAAQGQWPVVTGPLVIEAATGSRVGLDGLLLTGPVTVTGAPARVWLSHCTLAAGLARVGGDAAEEPALVVDVDLAADTDVRLAHCVSGPLVTPEDRSHLAVSDSVVGGSAGLDTGATDVSVLVGAPLAPFPALAAAPRLSVRIGISTAVDVVLPNLPSSTVEAAVVLEAALGSALGAVDPDHPAVRVAVSGERLVLVGSDLLGLAAGPHSDGDDGATALGLGAAAHPALGRLGGRLATPETLAGLTGTLPISLWESGAPSAVADLTITALPATLAGIAEVVSSALAAGPDPTAVALAVADRLLLVSGGPGRSLRPTTRPGAPLADRLALVRRMPRIAGSRDGLAPGAPLVLDRSTVLGDAFARSVEVSDSIVAGRLVAARRQSGCVRYSWIGAGSASPRRFRTAGGPADLPPSFTSTDLGHPGLAQLRPDCPAAIAQGAESGAEMGAFHDVGQPERLAAAQSLLPEYLRFTAEAGVFLAS